MSSRILKTWGGNKSVRLKEFDYSGHFPCHTVIRATSGCAPFTVPALAIQCCDMLVQLIADHRAYLGCYCLMPDHLHILLSPAEFGLTVGEIVGRYKSLTTRASWEHGRSGKLWQPRYYDHIVRKSDDIGAVARYIFENPDRRGFSADYPYRWVDVDGTARLFKGQAPRTSRDAT